MMHGKVVQYITILIPFTEIVRQKKKRQHQHRHGSTPVPVRNVFLCSGTKLAN